MAGSVAARSLTVASMAALAACVAGVVGAAASDDGAGSGWAVLIDAAALVTVCAAATAGLRADPSRRRWLQRELPVVALSVTVAVLALGQRQGPPLGDATGVLMMVALLLLVARHLVLSRDASALTASLEHRIAQRTHASQVRERRAREEARLDVLTGLGNRLRLTEALDQSLLHGERVALLLLDLNHFKDLNDRFGHAAGDTALQCVADLLRSLVAEHVGDALVARLGGDEFAILVHLEDAATGGAVDDVDVALLALAIHPAMAATPINVGAVSHTLTASTGWAIGPGEGATTGLLLRSADVAMYEAKSQGLFAVRWTRALDDARMRRLTLVHDLRAALQAPDRGRLSVVYQPIVDLRTGAVVQVEALARWQALDLQWVPPTEFVAIAEEAGITPMLTDFVMATARADSTAWRGQGVRLGVSVNLSAADPFDAALIDLADAWSLALESGELSGPLEVEVTETAALADPHAARALGALVRRGVGVAIDDFGTGYSSLAQVEALPATRIKIDRSLVAACDTDPRRAVLVRAVVQMTHELGATVIAEGVETAEVADALRAMGCDLAQGWHFGHPVSASAVPKLSTIELREPQYRRVRLVS